MTSPFLRAREKEKERNKGEESWRRPIEETYLQWWKGLSQTLNPSFPSMTIFLLTSNWQSGTFHVAFLNFSIWLKVISILNSSRYKCHYWLELFNGYSIYIYTWKKLCRASIVNYMMRITWVNLYIFSFDSTLKDIFESRLKKKILQIILEIYLNFICRRFFLTRSCSFMLMNIKFDSIMN